VSAALAAAARLAGPHTAGLPPGAHFGGGTPGPIAVTQRDYLLAAVLLAIAIVAAIGFGFAARKLVRHSFPRRGRREEAASPNGSSGTADATSRLL
jgi:hypothetical protein